MTEKVSPASARRIALAAQGFGRARPETVTPRHLGATIARLGLHQIDSVNVLVRAHYLPAFSRLGPYDRGLIDRAAWGPRRERRLFEYWAHEASLLPLALHPLLRWRMAKAERGEIGWGYLRAFARERRPEAEAIFERIRAEGPLAASDFEEGKGKGGWWEWGDTKRALEWLFWTGRISTATRRASFERVYDLAERVIPAAILALPTPAEADAQRALVAQSGAALGIATEAELRDYFRLKPAAGSRAVAELVEEGVLLPAAVAGSARRFYLHRDARRPRRISAQALLAPFDPLVWERSRTERLFGFRYRIGIYTPAERREHGYYVLPFLLDERLVARVDLKADRKASRLLVHQATLEPGAPSATIERLNQELELMARWLGLEAVRTPARS
ncbi:MAG TPA: crosslink repair DNA glycosylase YcaQ family protein [Allosphingosinicella sp.]